MESLLKSNEIEKLRDTFKTHPLLSTCYKVFTPRMARLEKGFLVTPEDVFFESARLLDFLLSQSEISQNQVDSLWNLLFIDIMKWGTNVTDHNKRMIAGTVFQVVRATLTQYYDSYYSDTICDLLNNTIERELNGCDEKEQENFFQQLMNQSPGLCDWINSYDESDEWLSDQIKNVISSRKDKGKDEFQPCGTTFTKTVLLTDKLIDIMGQRLTQANKLKASPDDWRKLFSGVNQQFEMIWLGTEGELRDFFKMLTGKPQYARPKRGFHIILQSHFIDEQNNRFKNLHGAKSIESFQPIIDDCSFLLQHLTDNMTSIMKKLIRDNEGVLREMGYFNNVHALTQAGLRIRNKRR